MADAGPPLVLISVGLVLWLAVNVTLAGIAIQTIGIILFLAGVAWLVIELVQARATTGPRRGAVVAEEPVVRERAISWPVTARRRRRAPTGRVGSSRPPAAARHEWPPNAFVQRPRRLHQGVWTSTPSL